MSHPFGAQSQSESQEKSQDSGQQHAQDEVAGIWTSWQVRRLQHSHPGRIPHLLDPSFLMGLSQGIEDLLAGSDLS